MEEARRFLRYVIPGLLLMIEVSLYLWLSSYQQFVQLIKELGEDIAFPISIFLASGGIGFLLGVVYYTLYWTKGIRLIAVNHLPLIEDVVKRGWLKLQRRDDGKEVDVKELTQSGAWRIVTSFWHERKESSLRIKAANARTDSLADIMHGLGTTFIGSIIAIPVWVFTHFKFSGESPCLYLYIIPLLISFVHFVNFRRVTKDLQSVVDIIMADEFQEEFFQKGRTPTIMNVTSIDLQKPKIRNDVG